MKRILKTNKRIFRFVCGIFIFASIVVLVAMCEDDKCKACTNSQTNETRTFCGDDLKEAEGLPHMTCK